MNFEEARVIRSQVNLTIDQLSLTEVLREVIPAEYTELPTSYEQVGHIAHLNLRDEFLPYRFVIGEAILRKVAGVRTVVNKDGNIQTQFRTFPMELLAGEANMVARHYENECVFVFDFSKVYWNSRLQAEHERIVKLLKPGEVLCDMMAGVGPFAIPAAKKGVIVHANDLNPDSYASLVQNKKENKIKDSLLRCYNLDARAFGQRMLYGSEEHGPAVPFHHAVMNLPASAIEFLDVFNGFASDWPVSPTIHCYCFSPTPPDQHAADVVERVYSVISFKPPLTIHHVRSVAPAKEMYCVSFQLPRKRLLSD